MGTNNGSLVGTVQLACTRATGDSNMQSLSLLSQVYKRLYIFKHIYCIAIAHIVNGIGAKIGILL
jgi:hypothetical protein